jgi:hypothetical protein
VYATAFPAVLSPEWLPPILTGRANELRTLATVLGDPYPSTPPPWVASVVGPSGSGTSATARLAARRLLEALRREGAARDPVLVRSRVGPATGSLAVAAGLLRGLDSGFEPRGFPVAEVMAGFLRRLAREGRPAVVVLDDIGPDAPDLTPIFRALLSPSRFLPEGASPPPCLWTILAGRSDAHAAWSRLRRAGLPTRTQLTLRPPSPEVARAVIRDRAGRALGRPPPEELVERIASRAQREEFGLPKMMDLLRRELLGSSAAAGMPGCAPASSDRLSVEPRVLAALERATRGGAATLGAIRGWEVRLATLEGVRPLPATTLWRRMIRLQAAGVIRRDVRPGGPGGTRSTIEVVGPIPFYSVTDRDRTRPDVAAPVAGGASRAGPAAGRASVPAQRLGAPGGGPPPLRGRPSPTAVT